MLWILIGVGVIIWFVLGVVGAKIYYYLSPYIADDELIAAVCLGALTFIISVIWLAGTASLVFIRGKE